MNWFTLFVIALLIAVIVYRVSPMKELQDLDVQQTREKLKEPNTHLIDVRNAHEFRQQSIEEAENIPLRKIKREAVKNYDKDDHLILVCLSGIRSKQAARKLKRAGFHNLYRLNGGMVSWDQDMRQRNKKSE